MKHIKRRTEPPAERVADDEEFRHHPDFEWIAVSNYGRLWSRRGHGRFLRPAPTKYGHLMVIPRRGHNRLVHRLVMEAFVGPRPEGQEVRHLNGDPTDNRVVNLAYGTRSQNIRDAIEHGGWWTEKRLRGRIVATAKAKATRAEKSECKRGHPLTLGHPNVALAKRPNGVTRVCRECDRIRSRQYYTRKRVAIS